MSTVNAHVTGKNVNFLSHTRGHVDVNVNAEAEENLNAAIFSFGKGNVNVKTDAGETNNTLIHKDEHAPRYRLFSRPQQQHCSPQEPAQHQGYDVFGSISQREFRRPSLQLPTFAKETESTSPWGSDWSFAAHAPKQTNHNNNHIENHIQAEGDVNVVNNITNNNYFGYQPKKQDPPQYHPAPQPTPRPPQPPVYQNPIHFNLLFDFSKHINVTGDHNTVSMY